MRKSLLMLAVFGAISAIGLLGCPWSNSPNIFESSKGISLPNFGGPPPQTEPEILDTDDGDSQSLDFDSP